MFLISHAEKEEKYSENGCSTAVGKKRIPASQPPEGDYEFALLLHDVLEGSRPLWTAKVPVPPSHLALSCFC